MKGWLLLFALAACGKVDDVKVGSRGNCAYGGTLTDCENADRTVREACWRLVDCRVIVLHDEGDDNTFDWDNCVNELEETGDDRQGLIVSCIASSTCDELRTRLCLDFGDL